MLVNAVELLRQPGSHRHLSAQVDAAEVDVADRAVVGPLDVEVDLDTTIDDIIVSGTVTVPWHGACRRCLTPLDEVLRVEEGSLYPALHRMEQAGWIAAEWRLTENNRRARLYRLTKAGDRHLEEELAKWSRLTKAVGKVLRFA